MFAIETDLGRFEADTERDAKRLLRKAARDKAKQDAIDTANRDIARLKARAEAYRWVNSLYDPDFSATSHPWVIELPDPHFPTRRDEIGNTFVPLDNRRTVELRLYSYTPVAVFLDCSGDVRLLWTREDWGSSHRIHCMAVGFHADQWDTEILPEAVTIDYAKRGGRLPETI